MKRRVHQFTSSSKPTPKAASSSTPTKSSDLTCVTSLGLVGFFVAAIPRHEAPRAPVHQQFEADAESGEQQHADESFVVMIGARIVEDVIAKPADREEEFRHHRADQRAAGGQSEAGQ